MRSSHPTASLVLSLLVACNQDQPSTAPSDAVSPDAAAVGVRVVTSLADPGDGTCDARQCTLREAINDPGSTSISFAPGLTGTITLARPGAGGGSLVIRRSLSVTGPSTRITIRRLSTDPAFRILQVGTGVTVSLTNLILRSGRVVDLPGGGVMNYGTLTMTRCRVEGSWPTGISSYGGLARLTLTNSTVANNPGTGVYVRSGSAKLDHSTVRNNSSSGVASLYGTVEIAHSTVAENLTSGLVIRSARVTVSESSIVGNSTTSEGGGILIHHNSSLTVIGSTIARNSAAAGGGIMIREIAGVTITQSAILGNSAVRMGGGILADGWDDGASLTLTNSTVAYNSAGTGAGIGILDDARVRVLNSTIARNSAGTEGGGIGVGDYASAHFTNTIVAQNTAPAKPDVDADESLPHVAFFSLIGDGTGSFLTNTDGNQVGNVPPNDSPIDPRLVELALNGGPTRSFALESDSPALDAGSEVDCPSTDQRGVARPQAAGCDIGSYERE
jgi:CSLREA domain-containing protein